MPEPQPVSRRAITIDVAERLLRSRARLVADGATDRMLSARVADGRLTRIRRGHYVPTDTWERLWPEGRHLLRVLAAARDAEAPPVFCGLSAVVLHGLPLYRVPVGRVHVLTRDHVGSSRVVQRHPAVVDDADAVEIGAMRVTGLARTVFDVSRVLHAEAAQSIADAALRRVAVRGQRQEDSLADAWREGMLARFDSVRGAPGSRRGRAIVRFADGRAQLPGESVSRMHLMRLGFERVELQVAVPASDGGEHFVDFGLDEIGAFGEFDGAGKYVDPELRGGRTVEQAVLDEKEREDWIRGVTGRRMLRWGSSHIRTLADFAARLRAFGVPLTGDLKLDRRRLL
ncbi:hypothetical protein [Microbacterium sp.]|uniref:hypothetical protein n=1 Tax=Microbacterium sp. TaxID=51671 RepID=UPI00281281E4|nr:hypothetical protein [Microbacterium sp.]